MNCGKGKDVVIASAKDKIAANCERVKGLAERWGRRRRAAEGRAGHPADRGPRSRTPPISRLSWALIALALVLVGVGAVIVSYSYDEPVEIEQLGRSLPVNEGPGTPSTSAPTRPS